MERQLPKLVNFSSKLVLQILPSVSATVIGGYLLAHFHVGHNPEPPAPQIVVTPAPTQDAGREVTHEVPTAREERATMRKVLKDRRENPQAPAVVRPTPKPAAAAAPSETASAPPPPAMDSIAPNEPVERAAAPGRTKPAVAAVAPAQREVGLKAQTEAATDYVPAPPPGLPAPATAMNAPTLPAPPPPAPKPLAPPLVTAAQPPVAATAVPPAPQIITPAPQIIAPVPPAMASAAEPVPPPPAPPPRGPVTTVFSALSNIVGHAANATGSTVNWVIDLPAKAISAGGRVISGPSSPPPPAHLGDGEG